MLVDDATGALLRCDLTAKFTTAADPKPVQGTVEVNTVLTEVAATAPIERPNAEDLAMRQRTLPEQRELLRGLGQARAAAEPPRPGGRAKTVVRTPVGPNSGAPAPGGKKGP
jgi:hypothetical protein